MTEIRNDDGSPVMTITKPDGTVEEFGSMIVDEFPDDYFEKIEQWHKNKEAEWQAMSLWQKMLHSYREWRQVRRMEKLFASWDKK